MDTEETEMLSQVLAADLGHKFHNQAPNQEGPGHRACMIYSAMICPFLAGPGARRGRAGNTYGMEMPKGDVRGGKAGVVAYDGYEFTSTPAGPGVVYGHPLELIEYESGEDLLGELEKLLQNEDADDLAPCPPWLLDDEAAVEVAFKRAIRTPEDVARLNAARHAEQTRRKKQKQAKASRRRNR
ncbi:hypothetical protein [Actinacidiphila soli]|uniref:hypothetical protein n=1 Tax=Actinacidiphila soli TaxID=2487275 RepID=UPI000FCB3A0E|nr:hypothetical protein [Actinacidiphila soli]